MKTFKHDNKETILEFFATDADMLPIVESMQEPRLYLYVYDETVVNYIVCERYENEGNFVETEAGTAEECREFIMENTMTKQELLHQALQVHNKREKIAQLNKEIEAINEAVEHADIPQEDYEIYHSIAIDEYKLL